MWCLLCNRTSSTRNKIISIYCFNCRRINFSLLIYFYKKANIGYAKINGCISYNRHKQITRFSVCYSGLLLQTYRPKWKMLHNSSSVQQNYNLYTQFESGYRELSNEPTRASRFKPVLQLVGASEAPLGRNLTKRPFTLRCFRVYQEFSIFSWITVQSA